MKCWEGICTTEHSGILIQLLERKMIELLNICKSFRWFW